MELDYQHIPNQFSLSYAYPNPFNPSTTVEYSLPTDSELTLSVYDIQGRLVTHLYKGLISTGYYKAIWNASKYSSGIYFIRMHALDSDGKNNFESTQKIMLIK